MPDLQGGRPSIECLSRGSDRRAAWLLVPADRIYFASKSRLSRLSGNFYWLLIVKLAPARQDKWFATAPVVVFAEYEHPPKGVGLCSKFGAVWYGKIRHFDGLFLFRVVLVLSCVGDCKCDGGR